MTSERRLARIAGSMYLVVALFGGFAELVVRDGIVEAGNGAATADSIRGSATLFRLGFASDLVQATVFLLTAMALYVLLRHVNELVARAMVVIVAVSVAIICLNLLNQFVALQIATGQTTSGALGPAGSDALAGLFTDMHGGYLIAQIFFGLWLLPLGYLVYRSGSFPKVLGVLLAVGCFGYLIDTFVHFLAPGIADTIQWIVVAPAAFGELWFVAYLLLKGVRVTERPALVPAA
ncbi:MAG: DUF4386 domain-containing protein [Actinomycetota bacterium]